MSEEEKLVAVISPWAKLSELLKRGFRLESLAAEKKVMVWREDLQAKQTLTAELNQAGITSMELRKETVTAKWQDVR